MNTPYNSAELEKKDSQKQDLDLGELRNITLCLSSLNKNTIENTATEFCDFIKKNNIGEVKATKLPKLQAKFTSRKSPCGNGTATWTKRTLRIHQVQFILDVRDSHITTIGEYLLRTQVKTKLLMNF